MRARRERATHPPLPPELVEAIAARAAELALEQLGRTNGSPWLTRPQAAQYLGLPLSDLRRTARSRATARAGAFSTQRQSSVENILKPLRAVLAYAVKEKLLSASPSPRSRRTARPRTRSRTSRTSGRTPSSSSCSRRHVDGPPSTRAATTTRRC
jgi:hypothetical protein